MKAAIFSQVGGLMRVHMCRSGLRRIPTFFHRLMPDQNWSSTDPWREFRATGT